MDAGEDGRDAMNEVESRAVGAPGSTSAPSGPGRRVVVKLNGLVPLLSPRPADLPAAVAQVEEWGAHAVVLGQHLFYDSRVDHGSVHLDPTRVSLDPLLTLAAIAAATSTIQLTTGAIVAPLYSAPGLGKAVATLDQLSRGRVELGVVAGWQRSEFDALGVPFDERFARLEEIVSFCRVMWAGSPFSFDGRWTRVQRVYSNPVPWQGAGVPILIGGRPTRITARRVARLGDGWIASEGASVSDVEMGVTRLRAACAELGGDPARPRVRATARRSGSGDVAGDLADRAGELFAAGATDVTIALGEVARDSAEAEDVVRAVLERAGHRAAWPTPR
jgi:probable F420-dependent oxidoreductase